MLSAIYIKGFKTFARPVRMPLEGGVTAVVGPNGSGKSNITDAVLFALGEQSPGLLRAGAMGDLIFSGSETLTGANIAEVTLVMDNESGRISLPYKEVSISRRITRGGETEYRINGSRSRLADVRAVAGEAGLGRHSILRQGAVDAIVAGGAAACRLALEEAAGLGVYRRRRLSASRRLEKADIQLEKTRQLEAEITDQLRKIEREAVAARRYRELESRYRRLSLAYLYRVATQGLDGRRRELQEGEALVSELLARETALREEEAKIEPELRRVEGGIRSFEQHLENVEDLAEELRAESPRTDRALFRLEATRGGEDERARRASRAEEELRKITAALSELEREVAQTGEEYKAKREELSRLEKEAESAGEERSTAERERARLVAQLEKARARRGRSASGSGVLSEEELGKVSQAVGQLERLATPEWQTRFAVLQELLKQHRQRAAGHDSEISRRRGKLDAIAGRVESRVRSLRERESNGSPAPRLEEIITARPGYEAAVEAAIGEFGRGVLARNLEEGMALVSGAERIALRLDAEKVEESNDAPGKPLLECVEVVDGRYAESVESLLGGIYVVESASDGALTNGYVAVTREGLRLTRTSISVRFGEGRFTRAAQLAAERQYLESLEAGPGRGLTELQDTAAMAESRLRELEKTAETAAALDARVERASGLLARETGRRRDRATDSRERYLEDQRVAAGLEKEISAAEFGVCEAEESAAIAGRKSRDASATLEAELGLYKKLEHRRDRLRAGLKEGERRRSELSGHLEKHKGASESDGQWATKIATRAAEATRQLATKLKDRRAKLRDHRAAATETHRRISEDRATLSRRAVGLAGELATARAAAARLQEKLEKAESASESAAEEIHEEWGATLEMAHEEFENLPGNTEKERSSLARELKRFGDVNLLALSQEEGFRQRHEFVAEQRADAEAASTELNRIILEIDREIEDQFTRTFERVREAFAEIMPRMMRGASGSLELSEEGVEVGLRLGRRGRKPLNVLSGGERSLLALSFLFSIFLSRPGDFSATFCMLDEAEAALDDVNLARFLAVVDSYRASGQFILVTHQKRTMAAADVLYGVTQDASGATVVVSKRLSGE